MKKFAFCIILFAFSSIALADNGFDDQVNDVPIDGGISVLLAAGLGYGAKKARDAYKASKHEDSE